MNKITSLAAAAVLVASCATATCNVDLSGNWTLRTIDGQAVTSVMDQPTIEFNTAEKSFHANTGVNILNGSYELKGDVLKLKDGPMTKMAGAPEAMAVEDRIIAIIQNPLKVSVADTCLFLAAEDGTPLMEFGKAE